VHGGLFVAHQDVLDPVLLEQLVVKIQYRPAGIAENVFDLFFLQTPDYNLGTRHHHGHGFRPAKKNCWKKRTTLKPVPGLVKVSIVDAFIPGVIPSHSPRNSILASPRELSDFLVACERRAFKQAMFAVRNEETALDIVQDSMMKLAEKYGDRPAGELPMLFQRIIQNTIRDHYRRSKVRSLWTVLLSAFSSGEDEGYDPLETL
jgi:hypothetical protein